MTALRRKRVWTVTDFAKHAFGDDSAAACTKARRFLKRLNEKHNGKLLIPSVGENRQYTFIPALLAKLEPDIFTPIESIEFRLEAVEEDVGELRRQDKIIASQIGQNTRDIGRMQLRLRGV